MSKVRHLEFFGSWFWLIFWLILFFPIAILYLAFNTIVVEEEIGVEEFIKRHCSRRKSIFDSWFSI
jgi:membrane protein required for beta-lactamase induction